MTWHYPKMIHFDDPIYLFFIVLFSNICMHNSKSIVYGYIMILSWGLFVAVLKNSNGWIIVDLDQKINAPF